MDSFAKLHPLALLLYYGMAVFLMIWLEHPGLNCLIWFMALLTYISFAGGKKGVRLLGLSAGGVLLCLIINPLFNQRGLTLLFMVGDMRITLESVLAGGNMASLLMASLLSFAAFSHFMTSEKIMTLCGRRMPSLSLLFSMVLRFVPKAGKDFREMAALHGSRPAVWSAFIGLSLEDALERSLSMTARGYGRGERSSYYYKKLSGRDILLLIVVVLVGAVMLWQKGQGFWQARFFPGIVIKMPGVTGWLIPIFFYSIPLLMKGKEEIAWHLSRRKITSFSIQRNPNQPFPSRN
ncbi:MAG: hypothetical protein J1F02_10060 [Lachnospiraceae bacterium]|nr:hypothetical protein [Lachnospiraceae bacterium]